MKKILSIAFCGLLGLSFGSPIMAAESQINATEKKILDRIEQGITIEGETLSFVPGSDEYESIKELFSIDGFDLSEADYAVIKTSVVDFQAFMEKHYNDVMTIDLLNEMIVILNPASEIFGMRLGYDAVSDVLNVFDMEGNIIYTYEEIMGTVIAPVDPETPAVNKPVTGTTLENTGDNFTQTFAAIAAVCGLMIASGYSLNKKRNAELTQ